MRPIGFKDELGAGLILLAWIAGGVGIQSQTHRQGAALVAQWAVWAFVFYLVTAVFIALWLRFVLKRDD